MKRASKTQADGYPKTRLDLDLARINSRDRIFDVRSVRIIIFSFSAETKRSTSGAEVLAPVAIEISFSRSSPQSPFTIKSRNIEPRLGLTFKLLITKRRIVDGWRLYGDGKNARVISLITLREGRI